MNEEKEILKLLTQFDNRVKTRRNFYLESRVGRIYLRNSLRILGDAAEAIRCLDVANVHIFEKFQGRGIFRRVFDRIEEYCLANGLTIFVESIESDIVADMCDRRQYHTLRNFAFPELFSMYAQF